MKQSLPSPNHPSRVSPRSHEASATRVTEPVAPESVRRTDPAHHHGPTLPPVNAIPGYASGPPPTTAGIEANSPVSARPIGMHSLLNPSGDLDLSRPPQRVSQSPGRSVSAAHGSQSAPLVSPRSRKRKDNASPVRRGYASSEMRHNRRTLTPRSPALRSMSQGMRESPSASRSLGLAQGSAESRFYTAEPGETVGGTIPPLPPITTTAQGNFPSLQAYHHTNPPAPGTHSNSTASYSVNTQGYMGSPSGSSSMADREDAESYRHALSDSTSRPANTQQVFPGTDAQTMAGSRTYGAGQPAYSMQLSTEQGTMILPVEVDIQQASKLADEKRKRNAGASARFRQRRKEKEQAASTAISDLQKQLRDLSEERDFYLGERNVFRDMVSRSGTQYPPRPQSPRIRRAQNAGHPMTGPPEPPLSHIDYGRRDILEPSPAQRRRTSEYQPSFGPPASVTSGNYPPPFPPTPGPAYPLPPPSLPAPTQDPRAQPPASAAAPPHPQHAHSGPFQLPGMLPQPFDPYRRDNHPH